MASFDVLHRDRWNVIRLHIRQPFTQEEGRDGFDTPLCLLKLHTLTMVVDQSSHTATMFDTPFRLLGNGRTFNGFLGIHAPV